MIEPDQPTDAAVGIETPPPRQFGRIGRGALLILLGACAGFAADRYFAAPAQPLLESPAARQAPFTRFGDRIVVPPDSPLRTRLAVAEPEMKEVAHTLVLPTLVEADPTRTVKVMPPVAGRITDLKVRLGERVSKDQDLVVIDSGDLAQAYSDRDKARAQLSAQNDYAQAQSSAPMLERVVLPTSALLMSNDHTSVFVEVAPWTFERRDVETDYQEGDEAIIKSNLDPRERVVVRGGVVLND